MGNSILPRERVELALSHMQPDRVPTDFWSVPEVITKLQKYFKVDTEEEVLSALQIDVREINPVYIGPALRVMPDGSYYKHMGHHVRNVSNAFSTYEEYISFPLAYANSVDDLRKYEYWPNPDNYDYENLVDRIGNLHDRYYIKLFSGGLFELAWELRGLEQFYMDMVLNPEMVHFTMQKLTDFFVEYVKRTMQVAGEKYDAVYTYDDIASQRALLVSKSMWSELIKPYHVQLGNTIKSFGKKVLYHSCGAIYDMLDELKELPIDILNPIQPLAVGMDIEKIKKNYGSRFTFHGGIDIQYLLPYGTKQEIVESVGRTIDILGKDGGYILTTAHNIQNDTSAENIETMYTAARNHKIT